MEGKNRKEAMLKGRGSRKSEGEETKRFPKKEERRMRNNYTSLQRTIWVRVLRFRPLYSKATAAILDGSVKDSNLLDSRGEIGGGE